MSKRCSAYAVQGIHPKLYIYRGTVVQSHRNSLFEIVQLLCVFPFLTTRWDRGPYFNVAFSDSLKP